MEERMTPKQRLAAENDELKAQVAEMQAQLEQLTLQKKLKAQVAELKAASSAEEIETPVYQMNAPAYLSDVYIMPGWEVQWLGEPNEAMVPMNQAARDAWEAFQQRQLEGAEMFAKMHEVQFQGLLNAEDKLALGRALATRAVGMGMKPITKIPELGKNVPIHGGMESAKARAERQREMLVSVKDAPLADTGRGNRMGEGMNFGHSVAGGDAYRI